MFIYLCKHKIILSKCENIPDEYLITVQKKAENTESTYSQVDVEFSSKIRKFSRDCFSSEY